MHLPNTLPLVFWLDPSERFVNRNSNNTVNNVYNKVNGDIVTQTVSSAQPTWSATALAGTPGLIFTGSQSLIYDQLSSVFSGTEVPMTISFTQQLTSLGSSSSALAFGNTTIFPNNIFIAGGVGGTGKFFAEEIDSTLTNFPTVATTTNADLNPHVITIIRDGSGSLTLRIDGKQPTTTQAHVAGPGFNYQYNTFTIGSLRASSQVTFLNGILGDILIYYGASTVSPVEDYLMNKIGIAH